jgi:hypothetical protein
MEMDHYEVVPALAAEKVIAAAHKQTVSEEED